MVPTPLSGARRLWPLVVLLIALATRLWGIDWQLPAALYFDELKYVAWAGEAKGDAGAMVEDLRNPTLFHHVLQVEYAVASAARGGASAQEAAVFELRLARITSAVLGALACLLTALATSRLARAVGGLRREALAGLSAGLVLALAPLHVHLSHYAVNDATASLFLATTLLFGSRALAGGSWRVLLLAGVAAGLAFSTKYSFAIGLAMPLVGALLARPGDLTPRPPLRRGEGGQEARLHPFLVGPGGRRGEIGRHVRLALLVLAGFVVGAVLGGPEIVLRPGDVIAGVAEQARLGSMRWNGQSDAPVWLLYAETLVQGFGWPALLTAAVGVGVLAWRGRGALAAVLAVPLLCLAVMLRQELYFARFALPLLPSLAMLAGIGVAGLIGFGVSGAPARSIRVMAMEVAVVLAVLGVVLLPEALTTVRHNQLATTTDTRLLARRWLRQRGDGARVATEIYGQPLAWTGSEALRGFRLQRHPSFVDPGLVTRLACEGTRYFLVASLTSERELARRSARAGESGYDLLTRQGRAVMTFDPFWPGMSAPAHPDNTGIPFWHLEAYARPGPKITVYELPEGAVACRG